MPTIPSTISLDVSVGPEIKASEHNTNNTAIQTAVNDLIGLLAGGSTGDILTKTGASAAGWSAVASTGFGTSLPGTPSDGQTYILTDSTTAPTYVWYLRYVSAAAKWYPQSGSWGYGTSLPSPPAGVDKVEFSLVDSTSAPTYVWAFRYNAASGSTYKWEFAGGSPAVSEVLTNESTSSTAYAALTTAGPTITVPRAGDYDVTIGFRARRPSGNGDVCIMSYDIGATAASDNDAVKITNGAFQTSAFDIFGEAERTRRKTAIAAATALTAKYKSSGGNAAGFESRIMFVRPFRVA